MVKKTESLFAKIPYSCLEAISKRVSKSPYDGHLSTLPTQLINQILYSPPPPPSTQHHKYDTLGFTYFAVDFDWSSWPSDNEASWHASNIHLSSLGPPCGGASSVNSFVLWYFFGVSWSHLDKHLFDDCLYKYLPCALLLLINTNKHDTKSLLICWAYFDEGATASE